MTKSTERREIAIVSGASSGIGAATARDLAERGFHVLAGVRRNSDGDAIRGPGVGVNVPVEVYAIAQWRHLFEVNLFGHVALTQALLPDLVHNKGRVVNISSVGGRVAMATYGPYAATKFALEAVSDSLRRELVSSGVHVVVVEPGGVLTEMPARVIADTQALASAMTPEQDQRYGRLIRAVAAQTKAHTDSGVPAEAVAAVIAKAITARKPRTRYTVGREAALLRVTRLLPDRVLDKAFAAALRPHFSPEGAHEDVVTARL